MLAQCRNRSSLTPDRGAPDRAVAHPAPEALMRALGAVPAAILARFKTLVPALFAVLAAVLAAVLFALPSHGAEPPPAGEPAIVTEVAVERSGAGEAVRFELTQRAEARLLLLHHPDRIAIDFVDALPLDEPKLDAESSLVAALRHGATAPTRYRYIVTPARPVEARLSVEAGEAGGARYRLALKPTGGETVVAGRQAIEAARAPAPIARNVAEAKNAPQLTIVLDPGHGGDDNGAVAANGVMEKTVNLAAAKAMRDALLSHPGIEVVMTREDDTFVPLAERTRIARAAEADLFISLHADSIRYKELRGATIYTLSDRASDALSREIADNENAADRFAGEGFEAEAPEVFDILVDLTRRETVSYSEHFAGSLLKAMQRADIRLIKNPKRSAGFRVLKAPDVPSVLIELGFLSNEKDAELLESEEWRISMGALVAHAIADFYGLELPAESAETQERPDENG